MITVPFPWAQEDADSGLVIMAEGRILSEALCSVCHLLYNEHLQACPTCAE